MATTKFKGNPIETNGDLPKVGEKAPDFTLVATDLSEKSLSDFAGKKKIVTINPSIDTGVCQKTARRFNEKIADKDGAVVLYVSADLPFALQRFCGAEGLEDVHPLSTFRSSFATDYGVEMQGGPLKGLTARAVLVLDENDQVVYSAFADDITVEPDYDAVLAAL
jgi:thiol peroxidase